MLLLKQVESVLGREDAEMHLNLIEETQEVSYDKDICIAFVWSETPQGYEFWVCVHSAIDGSIGSL